MKTSKNRIFRLSYYNNLAFFFFINNDIDSARWALAEMKKHCANQKKNIELFEKLRHVINICSSDANISYDFLKKACEKEEKRALVIANNHYLLARCCIELGLEEEALENLKKVINIGGENVFIILATELIAKLSLSINE